MIREEQIEDTSQAKLWNFADWFYFLVERMWVILIVVIGSLAFGLYKWRLTPDSYKSLATIEVHQPIRDAIVIDPRDSYRYYQQQGTMLMSMKAKLSQAPLYRVVVEQSNFSKLLPEPSRVSDEEFERAKLALARQCYASTEIIDHDNTQLLSIVNVNSDPETAQLVVSSILEELRKSTSSKREGTSAARIEQLNREIEEIRSRLSSAEESLSIYNQALDICKEIRESEGLILEMRKVYLDKWPPLVQERKHLELLNKTFETELDRIIRSVASEKDFWESREALTEKLTTEEIVSFKISNTEARHSMINRDFTSDSKLYESLMEKVKMGDVAISFDQQEFTIIQPATLNPDSLRMTTLQTIFDSGWKGLLVGISLAYLISRLDGSMKRVEDLERFSNEQVLCVIPKSVALSKEKKSSKAKTEISETASEAFRTLVASLNLSKSNVKTVLVTSSLPSEGKSTTSCNLAKAEAEADEGKKIVLIDLDIRRPRIGEYLGLPNDHPGIYECFTKNIPLSDAIQKSEAGFDIIAAGNTPGRNVLPNNDLIVKLITVLAERYDRIIIDTAPVLAVSDTLIIAKHVDAICLVFRMWKTPAKALRRAISRLENNGTAVTGIVANSMPEKRALGQYNYYQSYSSAGYS
tara:strand:+ start:222 stop:2138 length:1917 start_codon:yes stop_codon:yes gene_type:complete